MIKTINIDGMKCMHCVAAVEKAIKELTGVKKYEISLDKGCVEVDFDDTRLGVDDIIEVIEDQGFGAEEA